jgi:hypothetical protein
MSTQVNKTTMTNGPPPEYEAAMAEIEERAARGEMTIAEVKREIFALRARFAAGPEMVMQWAAQAHAASANNTGTPAPGIGSSDRQASESPSTAVNVHSSSKLPA